MEITSFKMIDRCKLNTIKQEVKKVSADIATDTITQTINVLRAVGKLVGGRFGLASRGRNCQQTDPWCKKGLRETYQSCANTLVY